MTELKTLKDISVHSDGCDCENKIRQEAIKWIKYLTETYGDLRKRGDELISQCSPELRACVNELDLKEMNYILARNEQIDALAQIKWIKHFFNITEKDMKVV